MRFTYLPWLRRGVAAALGPAHALGPARATVAAAVDVNGVPAEVALTLHGPGDVAALAPGAVRRVDPAPDSAEADAYLFAAIELVEPDLPWRHTPAGSDAQGRLTPWMALAVVPERAATLTQVPGGLDRLEVPAEQLQPPGDAWAWAHVQYAGTLDHPAEQLVAEFPDRWLARVVSPRRLDPGERWLACLVPLFAAGRAAGLGEPPPADPVAFAWGASSPGDVRLPVLHSWRFGTSEGEDIETLARRIEPRELPAEAGVLPVDANAPGAGVRGIAAPVPVEGALRRAGPPEPGVDDAAFAADLERLLAGEEDPLALLPPRYADGPVPAGGWRREVALDVRMRAAAGLGAELVRQDQEALMASAWQQAGEVREANRMLGLMTVAREVGGRLLARHFAPVAPETLAQLSAPAHARIVMAAGVTLAKAFADFAYVPSATSATTRRGLRRTASVARRAALDRLVVGITDPPPVFLARPPRIYGGIVTFEPIDGSFTIDTATPARIKEEMVLRSLWLLSDEQGVPQGGRETEARRPFGDAAMLAQASAAALLAQARAPAPVPSLVPLDHAALLAALDPAPRLEAAGRRRLTGLADAGRGDLDPVRIAPQFPQPVSRALVARRPAFLLPGLEHVEPDSAILVAANARFVEALLLGMNHELRRELLWRGFPAPAGATFFHRFWETWAPDIGDVADWADDSELGAHATGAPPRTVLVVRGELIRRFPGLQISAVPDAANPDPATEVLPVLRGGLPPDVLVAGFPMPPMIARSMAFLLTQPPAAPRFGLDASTALAPGDVTDRDDLAWPHVEGVFATPGGPLAGRAIGSAVWGRTAADMAWLTQQSPIRVVLPGTSMVPA